MHTKEKIDEFIELFRDYKHKQQQQKRRGLNNFNLFTTLLKEWDEVRLHSRFLHFLLNPQGEHCQEDLFLELFLKECGLADSLNTSDASVSCEYKHIDLYLTDGSKHIIIENKIWAGDQHKQIKRYIEAIEEKNEGADLTQNLAVIYLSLDRKAPPPYSLYDDESKKQNGFEVENGYLVAKKNGVKTDKKYIFKSIHYNKEIKEWLEKSYQEIANITNLSLAISQYQEVIKKLYGEYKEKIMGLKQYLEGEKDKFELIKTMRDIHNEYPNFIEDFIEDFYEKSVKKLNGELSKKNSNWEAERDKSIRLSDKKYSYPLDIQRPGDKILFRFGFSNNFFHDFSGGIARKDEVVVSNAMMEKLIPILPNSKTSLSLVTDEQSLRRLPG